MQFGLNKHGRQHVLAMRIAFALPVLVTAASIPASRSFAQEKSDKPAAKPLYTRLGGYRVIDKPAAKSLYQRIGGYDVIAAIIDDFLSQMRSDPEFARFAGGRSRDSATRARQLVIDQICSMSGGPCTYIGRDMRTAHAGLKITDAEWDAMIKKYKNSLDKFKIAAPEQHEFLALIEGLRPAILEVPKAEAPPAQK